MLWRIGVRRDRAWVRAPAFCHGVPALGAELCGREELAAAIGAGPSQRSGALLTDLDLWEILVLAPGTLHAQSLAWQLGAIKRPDLWAGSAGLPSEPPACPSGRRRRHAGAWPTAACSRLSLRGC